MRDDSYLPAIVGGMALVPASLFVLATLSQYDSVTVDISGDGVRDKVRVCFIEVKSEEPEVEDVSTEVYLGSSRGFVRTDTEELDREARENLDREVRVLFNQRYRR